MAEGSNVISRRVASVMVEQSFSVGFEVFYDGKQENNIKIYTEGM
jgi:hypothetical protein